MRLVSRRVSINLETLFLSSDFTLHIFLLLLNKKQYMVVNMETNIIKGRLKTSSTLYDNFGRPINVFDVIISSKTGSMRKWLVTEITNDNIIKVDQSYSKFKVNEVLSAVGIISDKDIKQMQDNYFAVKAAVEKAKEESITTKYILGVWTNKSTSRRGIIICPISSMPGKRVLRADINKAADNINQLFKDKPNYKLKFFSNISCTELSTDIKKAEILSCSRFSEYSGICLYQSYNNSHMLAENIDTNSVDLMREPKANNPLLLVTDKSDILYKEYKDKLSSIQISNNHLNSQRDFVFIAGGTPLKYGYFSSIRIEKKYLNNI